MTLTVFRAGNSDVVALNSAFKEKFGVKTGSKVEVEIVGDGMFIKPVSPMTKKKAVRDFEKFWKQFEEENGGILDGLA